MNEQQIKMQAMPECDPDQMARQQYSADPRTFSGLTGAGVLGGQPYQSDRPTVRVNVQVHADRSFGYAIDAAKGQHRIMRAGWDGPGQYVCAQYPDKMSKMTAPYLYLGNAQGEIVPWVPSQDDLFANDWAILPIEPL